MQHREDKQERNDGARECRKPYETPVIEKEVEVEHVALWCGAATPPSCSAATA